MWLISCLERVGFATYALAIVGSFGVMVAGGLVGLWEIITGLLVSVGRWPVVRSTQGIPAAEEGVGNILEGFEFLLLAPLAFVIVVSVGNYLRTYLSQTVGARPIDGDQAEHRLHRVKGLIISLMISIVATDLVKRFVGQPKVNFDVLIFGTVLILIFSVYFVLLLRSHHIGR